MKKLIVLLMMTALCRPSFCQVSGHVVTAAGAAIPSANIVLIRLSDTALARMTITDDKGLFRVIPIGPGIYILQASCTGYKTWTSSHFELRGRQLKDMGDLVLRADTTRLSDVVIQARKPLYQQNPEGIVVNVDSSLMTKGSSALEVLERSPGVVIDHRDNNIQLNGKSGVTVMINGKMLYLTQDQLVAFLGGMSADDIEKIELLTTPPARYDAEGSAGVINIVLKRNKRTGTSGSASLTGGYGWGAKGVASLALAHNTNEVSLYGNYSYSHNQTYGRMFVNSSQDEPFIGGRLNVLLWDTSKPVLNSHNALVGLDVHLTPKTTIGGSLIYNTSDVSSMVVTHADYTILPDSLLLFDGTTQGVNTWKSLISSVNAERIIHQGEKINVDLDYVHFNNNNPSTVQSSFVNADGTPAEMGDSLYAPEQQTFARTAIRVGVLKIDYAKQLSAKLKWEAGLKGTYTRDSSVSGIEERVNGVWVVSAETSDNLVMGEGIGAAYASVDDQLSASTHLTVGVRYEYSHMHMDDPVNGSGIVDRKLGMLFPNVFFTRKLNDHEDLQLSYSERITRPSYNDLASFVGYSDPTAVYTGNPLLQPTISRNIKVGYSNRGYVFSLLLSHDKDPIAGGQLTESPDKDLLYISPQNVTYQNNLTFQTIVPVEMNKWWHSSYGFVGGLRQFALTYTAFPVRKTYIGYSIDITESFTVPHSVTVELSGFYNSAGYNGTVRSGGVATINAAIKKDFKGNGGSITLSASDLFRGMTYNVQYGTITQEAFSITNHVTVNTESAVFPIVKLTFSKSFGRDKAKSPRPKDIDEQDRIRR